MISFKKAADSVGVNKTELFSFSDILSHEQMVVSHLSNLFLGLNRVCKKLDSSSE